MGLFEKENVGELLGSLIKIGEVSSVDAAAGTASVVFDDEDSVVVSDLQVIHRNTFANRDYAMPDIGEDVLCLFMPGGDGFILGSVYAGEIAPPETSASRRTVEFMDGTRVSYDRETSVLSVEIGGTKIIADTENVRVEGAKNVTVKGNITLDGDVKITGTLSTDKAISAKGDISTNGDVKTPTVQLNTHMHLCAAPGTTSGTPVMTPVAPEGGV